MDIVPTNVIEESIENFKKLGMETIKLTQSIKEFQAEYDAVKSHFHPIVWFFIRLLYR